MVPILLKALVVSLFFLILPYSFSAQPQPPTQPTRPACDKKKFAAEKIKCEAVDTRCDKYVWERQHSVLCESADDELPLSIYSAQRKVNRTATDVNTTTNDTTTPAQIFDDGWDVHEIKEEKVIEVNTKTNKKKEKSLSHKEKRALRDFELVENFLASSFTKLGAETTIDVLNYPTVSCHLQPSLELQTEVGCLGKSMVAHEDEYRPQCRKFSRNFNYTLTPAQYDIKLAQFWIDNNKKFVKKQENGDLKITYDYTTFGCPLEPYQERTFYPDLRILNSTVRNSTEAPPYIGNYILIEIFGVKNGYGYTSKAKDAGCQTRPETLENILTRWFYRRRIHTMMEKLLLIFINKHSYVFDKSKKKPHIKFWDRVNYRSCLDSPKGSILPITDIESEQEYEVMNNGENRNGIDEDYWPNQIKWREKMRPKVLMFLAIAIDNDESFCNHHTFFGVSLPQTQELEDIGSFFCFVCFTFLWILLVVLGYWCRKSYIRKEYLEEARAARLNQAAWTVIYRYEKLLQESENKQLDREMREARGQEKSQSDTK